MAQNEIEGYTLKPEHEYGEREEQGYIICGSIDFIRFGFRGMHR